MMRVTTRQIAERLTSRGLKNLDVEKVVAELGEDLFHAVSRRDKGLINTLCDAGISKKAAWSTLREMRGILRGRNGKLDAQMLRELTESITPVIIAELYKKSGSVYGKIVRDGILKSPVLRKAAEWGAKKQGVGLTRYVDDLVNAGKAGHREGVKRGVRQIVSRGLKTALKLFRRFRPNLDMGERDEEPTEKALAPSVKLGLSGKRVVKESAEDAQRTIGRAHEAHGLNIDALPRKFEVVVLDDGTRLVNEYVLLGDNGDEGWKLISSERFRAEQESKLNKKIEKVSKE
jgi:hypothetical protein